MAQVTLTESLCGKWVFWWDGEYEGECELPKGHDGDHWDGVSWYDDEYYANDTSGLHNGAPC